MLSMLKLSTIIVLLSSILYAKANDSDVIAFEKKRVSANPRVEIQDVSIHFKKETSVKGWMGYVFNIQAKVQGKVINAKDTIFTNGSVIATDLLSIKNGKSLKDEMIPTLGQKYYDEKHLIAGNPNGKNKIVIFSDPLCPFCLDLVPDVIKHVKKYPDNTALYYYHFPLLRLHPAAGPLSLIMEVAHEKGVKDATLKIYEGEFDRFFESRETNVAKILEAANKVLGTNITLDELKKVSYDSDVKMGEDAMVQGTPTIYVNGEMDNSRLKYENIK